MQTAMKTNDYARIGKVIHMCYPEMLSEIEPKILRPQPVFVHTILLPALLKRFAELKEVSEKSVVGIWRGVEANEMKVLFIGVVVTLYDPSLLTGIHSSCMRLNLAEEENRHKKTP
jgi:hypothetical protein